MQVFTLFLFKFFLRLCYYICAFLYPVLPGVFHTKLPRFFCLPIPNPCFANTSFFLYLSRLSEKRSSGYKISILVLYHSQVPGKSVMLTFFNHLKTERLYYLRKTVRISERKVRLHYAEQQLRSDPFLEKKK